MKKTKMIYFKNREEWRKWLEENHEKEDKIALLKYKKHTGKESMGHLEAMEEAICFGWIDTTVKKLDEDRYMRNFSKRSKNSKWSRNTLSYAKRMIKEGKMSPVGLKYYKEGLSRETLDHGIPKNPDVPADLIAEFSKNKKAKEGFDSFPPSTRRMYLRWLLKAKQNETRKKRVKAIAKFAEEKRKMF